MAQSDLWTGRPSCSPSSSPSSSSSSGFIFFLPSGRFFPPLGSFSSSDGFFFILSLESLFFLPSGSFFLPSDHFFFFSPTAGFFFISFSFLAGCSPYHPPTLPSYTVLLRRPLVGGRVFLPHRLLF